VAGGAAGRILINDTPKLHLRFLSTFSKLFDLVESQIKRDPTNSPENPLYFNCIPFIKPR